MKLKVVLYLLCCVASALAIALMIRWADNEPPPPDPALRAALAAPSPTPRQPGILVQDFYARMYRDMVERHRAEAQERSAIRIIKAQTEAAIAIERAALADHSRRVREIVPPELVTGGMKGESK